MQNSAVLSTPTAVLSKEVSVQNYNTNARPSRLTIYPADSPGGSTQPREPVRRIDPKTFTEIQQDLERRTPYPRIIFDPLEYPDDGLNTLIQRIARPCGDPIVVVSLTERSWGRADHSLAEMRFVAMSFNADVVIRRQPSGHVIILFPTQHRFPVSILRDMLRDQELRMHRRYDRRTFNKMTWRMDSEGTVLYNGDFTDPRRPRPSGYTPTRISLDFIREHLRYILSPDAFCRNREQDCRQGNCTSHANNRCPLQIYGLPQCQALIQIRKSRTDSHLQDAA